MTLTIFVAVVAYLLLLVIIVGTSAGTAHHLYALGEDLRLSKTEVEPNTRLVEIDQHQLDHLLVLLEKMSAQIDVGGATGLRIEHAAEGVAEDLADSLKRASEVPEGEPGAAADAAVRQVVEGEPARDSPS